MDKDTPIEVLVGGTIAEEIEALRIKQQEHDDRAFDLQEQYNKLSAKAEKTGKPEDLTAAQRVHEKLVSYLNAGVNISEKIQTLRHPSELERRVNERLATTQRVKALRERSNTMADGTKKPTAKEQGFPEAYLNETGNFKIGMDARAKSDLIGSVLGLVTTADQGAALHVFTPKEAEKLIAARGWEPHLARKREIVEAATKAKADRQAEREEKAAAAAKEKEEKAAAKKQAAEAKKAAAAAAKSSEKPTTPTTGKSGGGRSSGPSKTEQARALREAKAGATK